MSSIRKSSTRRAQKIRDQICFFKDNPSLKKLFPKLLDYNESGSEPWYTLEKLEEPWITLDNVFINQLRDLLKKNKTFDYSIDILKELIKTMFEEWYLPSERLLSDEESKTLIEEVFFNRLSKRLRETSKYVQEKLDLPSISDEERYYLECFKIILGSNDVFINGKKYLNISQCVKDLKSDSSFLNLLKPPRTCLIHGDLHFGNVFINKNNSKRFKFIDPGAHGKKMDIAYDFGKLWHSFHGLYDFINKGTDYYFLSVFKLDSGRISTVMGIRQEAFKTRPVSGGGSGAALIESILILDKFERALYDYIFSELPKKLWNIVPQNFKQWLLSDYTFGMRVRFNEVVDFCSMASFHLVGEEIYEGDVKRSIALHLTGIQMLNQFCQVYKTKSYSSQEWLSVRLCDHPHEM